MPRLPLPKSSVRFCLVRNRRTLQNVTRCSTANFICLLRTSNKTPFCLQRPRSCTSSTDAVTQASTWTVGRERRKKRKGAVLTLEKRQPSNSSSFRTLSASSMTKSLHSTSHVSNSAVKSDSSFWFCGRTPDSVDCVQ